LYKYNYRADQVNYINAWHVIRTRKHDILET
jgi:hypothetical protein